MKWLRLDAQRYPLRQGETTIGRSPYCSIQLLSPQTSREHAAILVRDGETTLTDLGSRNGTYVNGRRIRETAPLNIGDRITIGGLELVVFENRIVPADAALTQEHVVQHRLNALETTTPDLRRDPVPDSRPTVDD